MPMISKFKQWPRARGVRFAAWSLMCLCSASSLPGNVEYPVDTVINVTQFPYFADPTGVQDSTAALQRAMDDYDGGIFSFRFRVILYFPNGTYRLTAPLLLDTHDDEVTTGGSGRGAIFQGQSRDGVVLKLDDNASGFGDIANPRILVDFNEANELPGSWQFVGFQIHIKDMTIDVGSGNPGAIGLDFCANNCGGVENLLLRSSDPQKQGHTGLLLSNIPGPQFMKNIEVDGFDYGIRTGSANPHYQTTMEDIVIRNSRINALQNNTTSTSIHRLHTENIGEVAVQNNGAGAFLLIVNGSFENGNSGFPAIENNGFLYARHISMTGHNHLIADHLSGNIVGPKRTEWFSGSAETLFPVDTVSSLNLPIKDAPNPLRDPPSEWVSVLDFGAQRNNDTQGATVAATVDDAPAFQAAIDSMAPGQSNEGKRTLYFPVGQYILKSEVVIPSYVERIVGCFSRIQPLADAKTTVPSFRIASGGGPNLVIEQLTLDWCDARPGETELRSATPFILNESDRVVLLKDIWVAHGQVYKNTGNGELFIENVSGTSSRYAGIEIPEPLPSAIPQFDFGSQNVWARQLNSEQKNTNVVSDGGDVWILGIKNEEDGTWMKTMNGGRAEILGGIIMPLDVDNQSQPGFESIDSAMTIVVPAHTRSSAKLLPDLSGYYDLFYDVFVRETKAGDTRELLTVDVTQQRNYYTIRPKVLTLFRGSVYSAAEHWRLNNFGAAGNTGLAADTANPDGDTLVNLMERSLGGDPWVSEQSEPVAMQLLELEGERYLALTFDRLTGGTAGENLSYTASGISYAVEYTTALTGEWQSALAPLTLHAGPVDNGNGTETVTFRTTVPVDATTPNGFLRLKAVQNP